MLIKFKKLKNLAVYRDFEWDKSVRENGKTTAKFKKVNILYGRNYSGKTTLSRVLRALETGALSNKYEHPTIEVEFSDVGIVNEAGFGTHGKIVRTFNEDFVRENLRFISNPDESINSFAILGEDNNRIESEIKLLEESLGSEEAGAGALGLLTKRVAAHHDISARYLEEKNNLSVTLIEKSNKPGSGIKHNRIYGDPNYNITKLERDLSVVAGENFTPIEAHAIEKLNSLLKEEPKDDIPKLPSFSPRYTSIVSNAILLAGKKIELSEPIKELLEDAVLQEWVRSGRELHDHGRTTCGYCGGILPSDLQSRLNKHFTKESEQLRNQLLDLQNQLHHEIGRVDAICSFGARSQFYSDFHDRFDKISDDLKSVSETHSDELKKISKLLQERIDNILRPVFVVDVYGDVESILLLALKKFQELCDESNDFTKSLTKMQDQARERLRLQEVLSFSLIIKYDEKLRQIKKLELDQFNASEEKAEQAEIIREIRKEIAALKAQLRDETKGAELVNHFLSHFFGHDALRLRAQSLNGSYKFEIVRGDRKAHHLSEGECSLIAFCYFMAKLKDADTKDTRPIIWIDDPICSLDENHIFFVFGLIDNEIVKSGQFEQLFVSTHNLDFLKYLKRLQGKDASGVHLERSYFIVEKSKLGSSLRLMPNYLKNYVTEFNYLFHQIHRCANADLESVDENQDCFYNYANNCRKFLEAYLYYRYPNGNDKDEGKLARFFGGDPVAVTITERINNEYSHLAGVFERSITPIDIPEMKKTSSFILGKIKEKDPEQYQSLLQSIGVEE